MSSDRADSPALRTLADRELLPETTLVLGSMGAAGWLAGYATAMGSSILAAASLVAVTGPLVGLKHVDNRARELEGSDA
ncbi:MULTISPECIES: hypothetical protein [Haloarcula]|uniref:hypothetical protein n=1 Tax=Haloarcula TaxID=2237 RepID=UPI0023E77412|nr:hypothetical protein [Halomicroarcula sp. SHR3]